MAVVAVKRGTETAGAQDAPWPVAVQRERGESLRRQLGRLQQRRKRLFQLALFQRGPVSIVARFGLCLLVPDGTSHFHEGLTRLIEVTSTDLQLAQAVEQSRHLMLLISRKLAEPGQQLLDGPALVLASD